MKIVISYRDKFIRKDLARELAGQYPNSVVESYADFMLAAKSVYTDPADVAVLGVEGIKVINMLRKRESDIRVIIVADNSLHIDEAYEGGADAYITIPYRSEELFAAIEGTYEVL